MQTVCSSCFDSAFIHAQMPKLSSLIWKTRYDLSTLAMAASMRSDGESQIYSQRDYDEFNLYSYTDFAIEKAKELTFINS